MENDLMRLMSRYIRDLRHDNEAKLRRIIQLETEVDYLREQQRLATKAAVSAWRQSEGVE